MKLGTIRLNGKPTVIARVHGDIAVAVDVVDMEDLILSGNAGLDRAANAIEAARTGRASTIDVSAADWMAPNPKASKILGCAVNNSGCEQPGLRGKLYPERYG